MMKAKIHQRVDRQGRTWHVTALCDQELLGKVLKEGDVTLDLSTYKSFYDGRTVTESEAVQLLQGARNVNAVGPQSVECAKKALSVDGRHVRKVQGVPHIHVYYV